MDVKNPLSNPQNSSPARVVMILDNKGYKIVINKGSLDGVKVGQRFLVYAIGEEVIDPFTSKSLGRLEIVKGTGKVVHVQEQMATIESDKTTSEKTIKKIGNQTNPIFKAFGIEDQQETTESSKQPFEDIAIGDFAKHI